MQNLQRNYFDLIEEFFRIRMYSRFATGASKILYNPTIYDFQYQYVLFMSFEKLFVSESVPVLKYI